ncbi:MAG TPA: hypothetical protein VGM37_17135 [Armatimonadota bacterium]
MRLLAAAVTAVCLAGAACAAPAQKTVSLAPADTSVRDAIRSFAAQTGARILIGSEVTGRVAMKLDDLPLESALTAASSATGNRWAKIVLPAAKAEALTPEAAAAIVSAAETLAATATSVQPAGAPAVSVGPASPPPSDSAIVYLVQPKADVAAIKAAREDARKKAQEQAAAAQRQQIASRLSPEAQKDPQLVQAYTSLQSMQPDQIAMLAREYMLHSTPEQRQAIGDALQRQREQGGPAPQ